MNKVTYDRNQIAKNFFDCNDLQQILNKIQSKFDKENLVVCNIKINDKDLSVEDESSKLSYNLEDVHFIEVETCEFDKFYDEFLRSSQSFIQDIIQVCPFINEAIQDANHVEFEKLFHDFIESMDSLATALHFIRANISQKKAEDWAKLERQLSAILQQILGAYAAKDYVILADLVGYEMIDELKSWHKILDNSSSKEVSNFAEGKGDSK